MHTEHTRERVHDILTNGLGLWRKTLTFSRINHAGNEKRSRSGGDDTVIQPAATTAAAAPTAHNKQQQFVISNKRMLQTADHSAQAVRDTCGVFVYTIFSKRREVKT